MKKILLFLWRHRGAVAKLLLALVALSIVLFLPLRSEAVISSISWDSGKSVWVDGVSSGRSYYSFSDVATVNGSVVALSYSAGSYDWRVVAIPTNVSCFDFARYGAKLRVVFDEIDLSGVPEGQSDLKIRVGFACGSDLVKWSEEPFSTSLGETSKTFSGLESSLSYVDVLRFYGEKLQNVPNETLYVFVYSIFSSISATGTISGGATVRRPVYTAFTEPIMSALSAVWGAIVAAIRRARSVLNSALGGFFGFFGLSAVSGSALLSLVAVMVILWLIHHRKSRHTG